MNALDLNTDYPRSPRATFAGYVIAGRALDKCRSVIAGTAGDYHYACPLDNFFFEFAGIDADAFKDFVATGACDDEVATWISQNAKKCSQEELVEWNNSYRYKRISEMPINLQVYLEGYIADFIPADKVIYHWFDIYDIEEKRI